MAKIIAFYGDATSCTKYSLDPIDWAAAQRAPDAGRWALAPQSGTIIIDPSFQTFPLLVNWGTAAFNPPTWVPDPANPGALVARYVR
jgi:hypothetical protein